ncbi:MAG: hypothetical protein MZW92_11555 [Comamonadaceae bacterium]|nr:hypothetical protein [Comamonadaceae bacterium]
MSLRNGSAVGAHAAGAPGRARSARGRALAAAAGLGAGGTRRRTLRRAELPPPEIVAVTTHTAALTPDRQRQHGRPQPGRSAAVRRHPAERHRQPAHA